MLAASGGGHLRQVLQLIPHLQDHELILLTERSALGASNHSVSTCCFVPHFAFGQRHIDGTINFLMAGLKNAFRSFLIVLRERPDVVVSSGAGAVYFSMLWAKLLRSKVVYIETIARVKQPSRFFSMVRWLSTTKIVQWPNLVDTYSDARFCNTLKPLAIDGSIRKKQQIFLTIGTFVPFDRMLGKIVELAQSEKLTFPVVAQAGNTSIRSNHVQILDDLDYEDMQRMFSESELVVCHGGSGSMLGALKAGCKVVAMPRLAKYNEVYDDHQFELIDALADLNLVTAAYSEDDLEQAISDAMDKPPVAIDTDYTEVAKIIESVQR